MLKKEITQQKEKKKEQNVEKEIFLYFFFVILRLSFIVNSITFKEDSILMPSSLVFISNYSYNNMSDRGIQFNPAPANARGSISVGQPIAFPSRVVVPELEAESGKGAKPITTAVKVRTLKFNFKQID
jgi:hypothetical protein